MRHASSAAVSYEPRALVQFLPVCSCGAPHPLASKSHSETCLSCGARVAQPGAPTVVPCAIGGWGPHAILARTLFAAGRLFRSLAQRSAL